MNGIKVNVLRHPEDADWARCLRLGRMTAGNGDLPEKVPMISWKRKMLEARHSPIRTLMFTIEVKGIPYYSAMHFVRHHEGVQWYVKSQRSDTERAFRNQGEPVDFIMDVNAEGLFNIAAKRLCGKADPVTRGVMLQIKFAVSTANPEFQGLLLPSCGNDPSRCREFSPCTPPIPMKR